MENKERNLANKLLQLRNESGLSQEKIAEYLGIDQSLVCKYESGERSIGMNALLKLSELYCISLGDLLYSDSITACRVAFRTKALSEEDLVNMVKINKIILNQKIMDDSLKMGK